MAEQIQQQTGFLNGYSHFAKIEDAAKGEIRLTVSVFSENGKAAVQEAFKSYKELKELLKQ